MSNNCRGEAIRIVWNDDVSIHALFTESLPTITQFIQVIDFFI